MAYNRLILNDLQNEVVEIARQIQDVTKCKFCNLARRNSANLFCGTLIKKKFNSKCDVVVNLKRIEADHCLCKAKVSLKFSSILNLFNPLIANPAEWSNTLSSQWLRRWIPNPGVRYSKPLCGSKVNSAFHLSEVNKTSDRNFQGLSGKK